MGLLFCGNRSAAVSAAVRWASSPIAALMLTTEALVAEIPEEKKAPMGGGHGGGGMEGMY